MGFFSNGIFCAKGWRLLECINYSSEYRLYNPQYRIFYSPDYGPFHSSD